MQLSRIGPIALEEPLGGKSDSNVLRGVHVERSLTLAVKLLPRSLVNRAMGGETFAADVKALTKLVHPNIARVMGGAMENGQPYIAMELVEGESLASRLERLGRLPWETMVDVADGICAGLEYAHKAGICHLRLTPSRVLLTPDGGVKLVGFEHAWSDRDAILGLQVPVDEGQYYPQEVFRGKRSCGLPTCDLFSLGVILYRSLTGEMPWPTRSLRELVQIRRDGPAPGVSSKVLEAPVWLDVLVAKLLEVHRGDRLPSAEETHRAIFSAKQKVAEGTGAAKQALSGKRGTFAVKSDARELGKLRKASAPREKAAATPFYERVWFLAAVLLVVIAFGAWTLRPANEASLYAKAAPLMASESVVDWQAAEPFVNELLARYPQTEHRPEIEEYQLRFAMHRAEEHVKNLDRFGRTPKNELERLYADAWRSERLGDQLEAWEKYEALLALFPKTKTTEEQAIIELTRHGVARLKAAARTERKVTAVVRGKLTEAQRLVADGELYEARGVLDGIISLYDGNSEVQPLVDEAREMIRSLHGR